MASLQEIRAKLAAAESKKGPSQGGDSAIYPHWNIEEGGSCLARFLPDGNKDNSYFWAERAVIKLPFNGIKGDTESKQVTVQVPCVEMWNESCPILTEVRPWFKDSKMEDMGRKYWKKRSYLFQGFVRENPLTADKPPANPIRRWIIGPQIFTIIKGALMDPELEEIPTHYTRGLDFRITKTTKGGYADYNTSKWSRKETPLTEAEQAAIAEFGLFDLAHFLPAKPDAAALKVMFEMFEASVAGETYDQERWGAYFKPNGFNKPESTTDDAAVDKAVAPVATPAATATVTPIAEAPKSQATNDILAQIRARQASKA